MNQHELIQNVITYILEVPSNQPPKVAIALLQGLQSLLKNGAPDAE